MDSQKKKYDADDLVEIIARLRDPENGCPWDKVQTHASIRKNFLEEVYEAVEAIDAQNPQMLREELGDVLMQIMLHSQMEAEEGRFDFVDVCDEVSRKLIFRHPHIFGATEQQGGITDWDALKNMEKGRRGLADEIKTVPATFPALMRAQKLQKRTQPYGLVSADEAQARADMEEARACLLERAAGPGDKEQLSLAAGALLFATANWMRCCGLDAEESLLQYTRFFARSCEEQQAKHTQTSVGVET